MNCRLLRAAERCAGGQRWQWDGVDFEVLHPASADYRAALKPNAMTCVLRVSNGAHAALLAGDIEQPQEARGRAGPRGADPTLQSDVLLVPHHGSKTSSSDGFLDAVQPALALVQAGYRNRFGHPAASVLERYREPRDRGGRLGALRRGALAVGPPPKSLASGTARRITGSTARPRRRASRSAPHRPPGHIHCYPVTWRSVHA